MSTMRTISMPGGSRFVAVRMTSGMAKASVALELVRLDRPVGVDLGVAGGLDGLLEPRWHLLEVEVESPRERIHVRAGDECAEVAEDDPRQQVQARVRAHERRPAIVLDGAAHGGSDRRHRVAVEGHEVLVVAASHVDDAGLDTAPQQHAVVRRLSAAAGVEGRAVEHDAECRDR